MIYTNTGEISVNINPDCVARVIAVHKDRYEMSLDSQTVFGQLKASVYYRNAAVDYPTVGDFVQIQYNNQGDSLITGTLPRRSYFSRRSTDVARGEQAIAANFDYVMVLTSLNNDFNTARLERYMTVAAQSGATPIIVLTKADMCDDYLRQLELAQSVAPDTRVHVVSALTGFGMDSLNEYIRAGNTLVFLGSSGVGKSSLLNALAGDEIMQVNQTRYVDSSKGRHTTTHRQLLRLPSGAMIIDTPGMRELGMWDVAEGLNDIFADVELIISRCRFSDCGHDSEPGCAVKTALKSGALDAAHWANYLKLKREIDASERRKAVDRKHHMNGRRAR